MDVVVGTVDACSWLEENHVGCAVSLSHQQRSLSLWHHPHERRISPMAAKKARGERDSADFL
jgi:hypothetical protein